MYLAIDIGGTNIKYATVTTDYEIIDSCMIPSVSPKNSHFLEYLINNIKNVHSLQGIGLSIPGIISEDGRILSHSSKSINELYGKNICSVLRDIYHVPVIAINDGDAVGKYECCKGYGKNYSFFLCILIGTGIGGCICSQGSVISGNFNAAGEFHKIPYYDTEKRKWRCIGDFCRIKALIQKYSSLSGKELSSFEIWDLYSKKESHAKKAVDAWLSHLTRLLITTTAFCNPDAICIGGGISDNPVFISELSARFTETAVEYFADYKEQLPQIVSCSAGSASNLLGAIVHLRQKIG